MTPEEVRKVIDESREILRVMDGPDEAWRAANNPTHAASLVRLARAIVALHMRSTETDERVLDMLWPAVSAEAVTAEDAVRWLADYHDPPCPCCAGPPLHSLSKLREHAPGLARLAVAQAEEIAQLRCGTATARDGQHAEERA